MNHAVIRYSDKSTLHEIEILNKGKAEQNSLHNQVMPSHTVRSFGCTPRWFFIDCQGFANYLRLFFIS